MRIGMMTVVLIAIVGFAWPAWACEQCPADSWGVKRCSSGHASGSQSCYGGSGIPCQLSGSCGTGTGPGGGPKQKDLFRQVNSDESPSQGFVLRTRGALGVGSEMRSEPEASNGSVEQAVLRTEMTQRDASTDRD